MKRSCSFCFFVLLAQLVCDCAGGVRTRIVRTRIESLPSGLYMTESDTIWMRCPVGWIWKNNKCHATESTKFYGSNENTTCPSGYRPPTKEEIMELLEDCDESVRGGGDGYCKPCEMQVKCRSVFGVMISGVTHAWDANSKMWIIDFGTGYIRRRLKDTRESKLVILIGPHIFPELRKYHPYYPAVDILAKKIAKEIKERTTIPKEIPKKIKERTTIPKEIPKEIKERMIFRRRRKSFGKIKLCARKY